MEYDFNAIEQKWQAYWAAKKTYKAENGGSKPKYYVLDMFPYPSGAGLHVGHPLGYIASDIVSRFKRLQGFNVLHPMGYDAFGLPAEQYAIQTGQHPAITTEQNIARYRQQLDKIGFSYDWEREVRTCDPEYYKWTQWAFIEMFNHYYDTVLDKAMPIANLIAVFEKEGNAQVSAAASEVISFGAAEWKAFTEAQRMEVLMAYRIAYIAEVAVNWCAELGTVLANDEVKDGISLRGGHPVEQKKMKQWSLRVSAYAERLLRGLDTVEWSDSLKEMQRNWIGRSEGAEINFALVGSNELMTVFTTRADTVFGVSFMVLAPESEWVAKLTTAEQQTAVEAYLLEAKKRNERERMADTKTVSGVFTGAYAINPFSQEQIPIWVSDYVLAGYGTGAIMAVPAHDSRDYAFARHFNLPIVPVVSGGDITESSYDAKEGTLINSGFLNGLTVKQAIGRAIDEVESRGLGTRKVNFRLRDAIFSRQRYWGEPFPVYYKNGIAYPVDIQDLPITLPAVDKFLPTETGEPPLGHAKDWTYKGYPMELSTMPGFAGSSAYYIRYMDAKNTDALVSKEANQYWRNVDLYIGGTEHATGHLIYSRFWNKFLLDLGYVCEEEPYKKLVNQGMIQGRSNFAYRVKGTNTYVSLGLKGQYETTEMHVDVNIVSNDILDTEKFKKWSPANADAEFILEDGKYICGWAIEKMSKSMYNVVNPDDVIAGYGADTLRMYEMFLGPLEMAKPWDTNGIDGVHRFLKRFWRMFFNAEEFFLSDEEPTQEELKILHKTIKKIHEDVAGFSFNTSVSAFMICVNELFTLKCNKRAILEPLVILLSPFAPHITEELWELMGHTGSISYATLPVADASLLVESSFEYPVSFNGKLRFKLTMPIQMTAEEARVLIEANEQTQKQLDGKSIKKFIFVSGRIVNIVC